MNSPLIMTVLSSTFFKVEENITLGIVLFIAFSGENAKLVKDDKIPYLASFVYLKTKFNSNKWLTIHFV